MFLKRILILIFTLENRPLSQRTHLIARIRIEIAVRWASIKELCSVGQLQLQPGPFDNQSECIMPSGRLLYCLSLIICRYM